MKIYVIIKSGIHEFGELSIASTEIAFQTKAEAEKYLENLPKVWTESVNGMNFFCERAVHETILKGTDE